MRADEELVLRGLSSSRAKARALIEEGKVFCRPGKGERFCVDKPSRKIPENALLEIEEGAQAQRFVSRAGLKLEAFIKEFSLDLNGAKVLDAGASTGGFTDCALKCGASSSACVDVGSGQLHASLCSDSRVKNFEKTDVRNLSPEFFDGELFDFICADLSFISLEKVLVCLWALLKNGGKIVCLVKPQFESTPEVMRKLKGVIRDESFAEESLEKIEKFFTENFSDAEIIGRMKSPIKGGDGNTEYLVGFSKVAP